MNARKIILLMLVGYALTIGFIFSTLGNTERPALDLVEVNDVVWTLAENWSDPQLPDIDPQLDFAVVDVDGELIVATREGLNTNVNAAMSNRDTIVDVMLEEEVVGRVIFYNNSLALNRQANLQNLWLITVVLGLLMLGTMVYVVRLDVTVLRPFKKLEHFANQVAAGNLDVPLEMDKHNLFGAFTESFDLMREELHKARENERQANESKKELVAQLSHDIKTPVASIKAVSELMHVLAKSEKEREQLEVIGVKAEQINALITDMFHATLEELKALPVAVQEIESQMLSELLRRSDYKTKLKPFFIPNALIEIDPLRVVQVFDNVVTNAYKYAKTDIQIEAYFKDAFLIVEILDFGPGVATEELPLLLQKFYRGSASETEVGYGLGLHISNYLMEQMAGKIEVENRADGFTVRVFFKLVGISFDD